MPKCAAAFEDLKSYLISPPILSKLVDEEKLYLYLVVSTHGVNSVLVRISEGAHKLVYYVSRALEDAETRYSDIEKLAIALFMSSKKLRLYFQSHIIMVITFYPLRTILHSLDIVRRLMKWSVAMSEFHIVYRPRKSRYLLTSWLSSLIPNRMGG